MYKILTSILTEYTYSFLIDSGLFRDEYKGCKRGTYGCKDQYNTQHGLWKLSQPQYEPVNRVNWLQIGFW